MASKKRRSGGPDSASDDDNIQLLLKLSNCCAAHGNTHSAGERQQPATERDAMPEKCQRDISSLCTILPRVESTYSVKKSPHAAILPHLCDFYVSVVQGRFCPHAPHLFQWGKGGTEVLPRIFYLYQHLATKAIASNTVSALKSNETNLAADVICSTIAQLISFIPSDMIQECVVRDLVQLGLDLAVIGQVLTTEKSVQVTILGESTTECNINEEYVLTFNNMDTLYVTWAGTFDILRELFALQRKKRLSLTFEETQESFDALNLPTTHTDCHWSFILEHGDVLSTALASMRGALLSSSHKARSVLVTRTKLSAANLLNLLLEDWESLSVPLPLLCQVVVLVSRTVREHLRVIAEQHEADGQLPTSDDLQLSSLCGTLLCEAVVFPPVSDKDKLAIRSSALVELLDCIPLLTAVAKETPFVKDDVSLAHVVLRAIHVALLTPQCDESYPLIATAVNRHGIFLSLFQLLRNEYLGTVAGQVLSALLTAGTDVTVDVPSSCRLAQSLYEEEVAATQSAQAELTSPRSGGSRKRGRSSSQLSPYRQQLPLRIERSPKRSRVAAANPTQATLATPSPPSYATTQSTGASCISESRRRGSSSCHEALGNTLFRALLNAKYILGMVDPCRTLFETTPASTAGESADGISKTVVSVSTSLCLLFSLLADIERDSIQDDKQKPLLQVASLLAKSIKAVAISPSSRSKGSSELSSYARRVMDCVIRVGLEAHFTIGSALVRFPKIHRDAMNECLDAISTCVRGIWAIHAKAPATANDGTAPADMMLDGINDCELKSKGCDGTCRKLKGLLSGRDCGNENDWIPCLCKTTKVPDVFSHDATERLESDFAMTLFERLATHERCALLTSLRPLRTNEDIDEAIVSQPMAHLFSSSSKDFQTTLEMLSLSPLFALSSVLATTERRRSSEYACDAIGESNGNATDDPTPLAHDLARDLSSCVGRLLYGKYLDVLASKSPETCLTAAAYGAVNRIHELCDFSLRIVVDSSDASPDTYGPFLRDIVSNPLSALAFILDCRLGPEYTGSIEESRRLHRDALFDSVEETYRSRRIALLSTSSSVLDMLSPQARIAKWKSIARTCLRSNVSEMAQVRSRLSPTARHARSKRDDASGLEGDEDEGSSISNPLIWLVRSAFADESDSFRFAAAQDVGRILSSNDSSLLYALFSNASDWRRQRVNSDALLYVEESRHPASLEHVVAHLFLEIDRLLCRYCHVPQSQLSFTMGPSVVSERTSAIASKDSLKVLPFHRSAVMALASMCEYADVESSTGLLVYENAVARLVRLWTTVDDETQDASVSVSALAFRELVRLNDLRSLQSVLLKTSFDSRYIPRLFSDILLSSGGIVSSAGTDAPSTLERDNRERHFGLLLTFIGMFLLPSLEKTGCEVKMVTPNGSFCLHCVAEFVDEVVPSILSAFISVKDYDSLLAVIGFKLFVLGEKRKAGKALKRAAKATGTNSNGLLRDVPLGSAIRTNTPKTLGIDTGYRELAEQTKLQCLAPETIEYVLPRMLMANDRSQLLFFLEVVLQKKCSLHQMISSRQLLMLKMIVVDFGRTGDSAGAEHALRTAARARENANLSELSSGSGSKQGDDDAYVTRWVSSGFMYLLVNVAQLHWKTRTLLERIRALRSLKWVLKFLPPSDAPKYLPQIMATVNMAMDGECSSSEAGVWQLRCLAIQVLSDFVRIAMQSQYEIIGYDLASIVVSLFPVLSVDTSTGSNESDRRAYCEASKVAIELLEWLTHGSNGQNLAPYFRDIPFLPPTKALDKVRDALKVHGVSFDNVLVFSATQNTQNGIRGSLTSDGGTGIMDEGSETLPTYSSRSLAALRRRLYVVRKLLSHENVSVRRVVLQHLVDTLRANRGLFHRLIESEEGNLLNRFVTVSAGYLVSDSSNGSVTSLVNSLLQICRTEVDFEAKQLLATCLGEVGAIGSRHLGEISTNPGRSELTALSDSSLWRLKQAPWQSTPVRYELRVVTKHLVVALKAATSSGDQHKIAFAIQQILVLLDERARMGSRSVSNNGQSTEKPEMSEWLRGQLSDVGVIETVEPFWWSQFNEVEQFATKEPPFFSISNSYFAWLSYWCRYMLKRSNDDGRNQWCSFFYACRTAIRSKAGMPLAEFIVPLLVLDRICHGNSTDERAVTNEFLNVFEFGDNAKDGGGNMSYPERRKSVNCAFMILDTLRRWSENETEERYHSSRVSSARSARRRKDEATSSTNRTESTCWLWEESVAAINRLLKAVPLRLQADAAASVGMHARALRLMEMASRAEVVHTMYDSLANEPVEPKANRSDQSPGGLKLIGTHSIGSVDTTLFKRVLGQLDDCETMEGMANTSDISASVLDDIMINESKGQWSGALYGYERALEVNEVQGDRARLEQGSLRCLLELGQLESVLHQVNGMVRCQPHSNSLKDSQATPYAVEAAWRLGRWSTLTEILDDFGNEGANKHRVDSDGVYRMSLGEAMRGLHERSEPKVVASITKARHVLMSDLANVARDSYARSYPYLVRLHCLREVENVCEIMCNPEGMDQPRLGDIALSCNPEGWSWNDRLAVVSSAGSSDVIEVRLALSRLAEDRELQGSLYLTVGKQARKNDLVNVAANFLAQAEACCSRQRSVATEAKACTSNLDDLLSSVRLQSAKLKHQSGESTAALRILGLGNVSGMLDNDDKTLQALALSHERSAIPGSVSDGRGQAADINRFSRRLLQSTRWMVEGGIKGGSEVIERFRIVQRLSPQWEKGYFQFAKYVDGVLESRVSTLAHRLGKSGQLSANDDATRQTVILRDENCMKYLLMAIEQYISALKYSSKHVYQALPRLLSLWLDFTSYEASPEVKATQSSRIQTTIGDVIARYQMEANDLLSRQFKHIPAHCLYTALPQLISRISHPNKETASTVHAILTRVLRKHPAQAMWSLAWLLHSADKERVQIGDSIFKGAQDALLKRKDHKARALLMASKSLFKYLIDIAKYSPKEGSMRTFSVKTWRGEAELAEFIPPVQEALSVSPRAADKNNAADVFPMMVPRMRSFSSKVQVMSSKAKPKKAKAFVIPAEQLRGGRATNGNSNRGPQAGDIGEIHFLVKQEAKGDLRKDARVQNLNNVINRLLAASNSSGNGGASRQQRRLHLRTFAVTCLSEDCGILEWVPNTDSMRNLIMQSYNPQASPFSAKRRGRRLANYGDGISLKNAYEKCQAMFFKNGNLHKAATMFEEVCVTPNPPLLYWYFVQNFMDPHSWYEARTQFTLSCAAWSAVGHVIGLGDRHSENILVDTRSGQCVHVDFDCIFDKGLLLPKPEVVPFRLSPNMIDAFGPIGAAGMFTGSLKSAMTTLRDNRDTLLSVLEPFTKDPIIDWKRLKSSQRSNSKTSVSDQRSQQAKRSITIIDERLKGIYNLRNPNFKKVRRTDGWSQDADDEMMHMLPLSVEGQVHKMITEATSHENLVQLYVGWMPWV